MYRWIVFVHVASVFAFLMAHGVSAFVAFAVRAERQPERLRALLALSGSSYTIMYLSLLLILVSGITLGFMQSWWGQGWIWAALVLLVLIAAAMGILGPRDFGPMRKAAGLPYFERGRPQPAVPPQPDERLLALAARTRPAFLAAIGAVGLALLLWLMMFKPF